MDGWMDGCWNDIQTDRWIDGWKQTGREINGWMCGWRQENSLLCRPLFDHPLQKQSIQHVITWEYVGL